MTTRAVLAGNIPWHIECDEALQALARLPDSSIHCVVTSPPYFRLRTYFVKGQIGVEPHVVYYVDNVADICRQIWRVLRDDGTLWLNLGDTFEAGCRNGNLMGIPWMVASALVQGGWIVRSEVIWRKLAPMPSPVAGWRWEKCRAKVPGTSPPQFVACTGCKKCQSNDGLVLKKGSWRPTVAHEILFMLTKNKPYYADQFAVLTPPASSTIARERYSRIISDKDEQFSVKHDHESYTAGANPRSVMAFKAENFSGDHYAVFPPSLPHWCLTVSTSQAGVCAKCGKPWSRILNKEFPGDDDEKAVLESLGWRRSCRHETEPVPAIVLDPFAGAGTTILSARRLGLRAIGFDLNNDYVEMAKKRIKDDAPLFN